MRQLEVRLQGLRAGVFRALAGVAVVLLLCSGAWAQKNKKNQPASDQPLPSIAMTPNDQIEHNIGEMLAAQQLGNLELMHKYYSDSATFVSSDYGPPIVGWKSWAEGLRTAEGGVPADADCAAEHLHLHTCGRGVGDVPVGFFGDAGDGKGLRRARADDAGVHESRQRLGGSAQPYSGGLQFAGASGGDAADAATVCSAGNTTQATELRRLYRLHGWCFSG